MIIKVEKSSLGKMQLILLVEITTKMNGICAKHKFSLPCASTKYMHLIRAGKQHICIAVDRSSMKVELTVKIPTIYDRK